MLFVRWISAPTASPEPRPRFALAPSSRAMLAAIASVFLEGALPVGAESSAARTETLAAIEQAISGLPPATREELAELFSLLEFAPTRCLVAGVWSPWEEASNTSVAAFLDRWRDSRFALLRSAYGALHQIVFGAWYAQPSAWPPTGYAGPPEVS